MGAQNACCELALETSSNQGSIALGRAGVIEEARTFGAPRDHSASLMTAVDALCRDHGVAPDDLASVFVSIGPGSFTGLRVGLAVGKMLALAVGAVVRGVPTMDVIARNALETPSPPDRAAVLIDAGRGRVFAVAYERRGEQYVADGEPKEIEAAAFLGDLPGDCPVICASGLAERVGQADPSRAMMPHAVACPRAESVLMLGYELAKTGPAQPAHELVPRYIRLPDAVEKWQQRHP